MMSMPKENLDERIHFLQSEIQKYGEEIFTYLRSLYSSTESQIDLKNDPRNMIKLLKSDVVELLKAAKTKSDYKQNHADDLRECDKLMSIVACVASTSDKVAHCDEILFSSDLNTTCNLICELDGCLKELPQEHSEWGSGTVCKLIRREAVSVRFRLQARLKRLYTSCVVIETGCITVHNKLKGMIQGEEMLIDEPILLRDVFQCLAKVGGIDEVMQGLIQNVWTNTIRPLWREKKYIIPTITSHADRSEMVLDPIARDTLVARYDEESAESAQGSGQGLGGCRMTIPQLLEELAAIFQFVCKDILHQDDQLARHLVLGLRKPPVSLGSTLIATITSMFPKTETELAAFQRSLEKPVRDFESRLSAMGLGGALLAASDADDAPERSQDPSQAASSNPNQDGLLSRFVTDLQITYADQRRREILARARDLLLADYHNCMSASGDARDDNPSSAGDVGDSKAMLGNSSGIGTLGSALRFESCLVSLAACRLLRLMHEVSYNPLITIPNPLHMQVLEQACTSSPRMASIIYQTSRDCLELFLAVIPLRFRDVIETVPRMGALFYNDCIYIAHNCTLLTHTYHQSLAQADPSLQGCVGFIDFLPRFRAAADRCLTKHVEEQRGSTSDLVEKMRISTTHASSADALSTNALLNNDEAAVVVVRHFERLRGQWQDVLQDTVYERIVGYLMETVLRTVISQVLQSDLISEAAASQIAKCMRTLEGMRTTFTRTGDDMIASKVASWTKFLALHQLLEFNLTEISESLQKRKFASFTANELTGLVKALFEESPRRQNILNAILQMAN